MPQGDRKEYPPSWSWDKDGPEVSGEVIEIRHLAEKTVNGRKFRETDVMSVEGPQGLVSVWLSPAALRRWLELDQPKAGDYVTVRFLGWEDILDRETGLPKPHPDDPSKTWQMRNFHASVDQRSFAERAADAQPYAPPAQDDDDIPF